MSRGAVVSRGGAAGRGAVTGRDGTRGLTARKVATMGRSIGERFDVAGVRRHRPDYQIVIFMGLLVLIGVIVLATISPARVALLDGGGSEIAAAFFMQKQLAYLALGLLGFGIMSVLPLRVLQKHAGKLFIAALAACALLFIAGNVLHSGLAVCTLGACRWLNVGFGTFQPAELIKFSVVLFVAGFLAMKIKAGNLNNLKETFVPLAVILGAAALFIIVIQKDLGTGITLFGILASMLFVAGINRRTAVVMGSILAGLMLMFVISEAHRVDRVLTFFQPHTVSDDSSYHIDQAKIALGSGGLLGVGLGKSVQAFGYLPEAINDSIFAIMGELFGFVGLIVIMALLFGLLFRIIKVIDGTADPNARLIVAGAFGWIATHTVVNIAAMTGIFPLTGITLPLLSFGGTSMLFMMMMLGIVFSMSRYTTHERIKEERHEDTHGRRRVGGPRYAGASSYSRP